MPETIFGSVPVFLIGAFAAAAYAPERYTKDVDYFVAGDRYEDAKACLQASCWKQTRVLTFPNARLGLHGTSWVAGGGGQEIDLITSDQEWANAAFAAEVSRDANGDRVIPLAFLTLMKLDSARAIDQADLTRILGRLSFEQLEAVITTIRIYYDDPMAPDDLRQYHALGKWEYDTDSTAQAETHDQAE